MQEATDMKNFLSDALFMPMTPDDYAKPSIVLPKIILGLIIILASLPVWWLMPDDTRDASLWWLIGGVVFDVLGGSFIIAGIQIVADRHALQPGTWLNQVDTRLKGMFARREISDESMVARVSAYLAEVDCAFRQSDPPGWFELEAESDHGALRLILMAQQTEAYERFVVMARYPVTVGSPYQPVMASLLNQINSGLAVGSLELNEGSIYVRYSLEWGGQIPKSAFNSAIARTIAIAEACYAEIVSVLNDESDDEIAANTRLVERVVTLH